MATTKQVVLDFANDTTCHGLSQIFAPDRRRLHRAVWAVWILSLTAGAVWQVTGKIAEYVSFRTSTEIHEEYQTDMHFPAVTICNFNSLFDIKSELELATVEALIRAPSPYRRRKPDGSPLSPNQYKSYDAWWEHEVTKYTERLKEMGRDRFLLSDEMYEKGWQLNDNTLKHCLFQQRPCSIQNFTRRLTPMGLCYTFTSADRMIQNIPGSRHGLVLYLDINQDNYTSHPEYGNPEAGVKVHVHNHDNPPQVDRFGSSVPAGMAGHMVLKKIERELMYKPWGVCTLKSKELRHHTYSTAACMLECRVDYISSLCNCRPYWAEVYQEIEECDAFQILRCAGDAEANFSASSSLESCGCTEACSFSTYDITASYSTFPSITVGEAMAVGGYENETAVIKLTKDKLQLNDPDLKLLKNYRDNHLMLDIFYDSLSIQHMEQSKATSEISLMSDFGGLLGLWLGMSFVTISEFIQFFLRLFGRLYTHDTPTPQPQRYNPRGSGNHRPPDPERPKPVWQNSWELPTYETVNEVQKAEIARTRSK